MRSKFKGPRSNGASGPVASTQEIAVIETALLSHGIARDGLLEILLDIRERLPGWASIFGGTSSTYPGRGIRSGNGVSGCELRRRSSIPQ